ncbi:MAG TPA: hypothetical protein VMU25_03975 [Candidatus Paceibacterota bacterium]|nr:hypothetical protein [Candidatus Paceibacterota bacterium]
MQWNDQSTDAFLWSPAKLVPNALAVAGIAGDKRDSLDRTRHHYNRETQYFQGVLIARLEGKVPLFTVGNKVRATDVVGSYESPIAFINTMEDIFTIKRVFYEGFIQGCERWSFEFTSPNFQDRRFPADKFTAV